MLGISNCEQAYILSLCRENCENVVVFHGFCRLPVRKYVAVRCACRGILPLVNCISAVGKFRVCVACVFFRSVRIIKMFFYFQIFRAAVAFQSPFYFVSQIAFHRRYVQPRMPVVLVFVKAAHSFEREPIYAKICFFHHRLM